MSWMENKEKISKTEPLTEPDLEITILSLGASLSLNWTHQYALASWFKGKPWTINIWWYTKIYDQIEELDA